MAAWFYVQHSDVTALHVYHRPIQCVAIYRNGLPARQLTYESIIQTCLYCSMVDIE